MKQVFQIEWIGGSLTSELIAVLLIDYFDKMKWPRQSVTVTEVKRDIGQKDGLEILRGICCKSLPAFLCGICGNVSFQSVWRVSGATEIALGTCCANYLRDRYPSNTHTMLIMVKEIKEEVNENKG